MLNYSREEAEKMPEGKKKEEIKERIREQVEALETSGDG